MKFLLCLAVIAVIAGAQALTNERLEKAKKINKECKEESGVSEESLDKIINGEFIEDDKIKAFVLCASKKWHLFNEDGEIDTELLRTKLMQDGENDEEVDRIVGLCVVKKDTPEDTAYHMYKCFRKNKPHFTPIE